jgi:hypothetical protein
VRGAGLRFEDVQVAGRRLAVVESKGGHHRIVSASHRFFDALGAYLHCERPGGAPTDRVFVVLKGPRRGMPVSAEGLDEILAGARRRAGLEHATCHQLRHTCLTRLREARMALEAVQAQAGHRSIGLHDGAVRPRSVLHGSGGLRPRACGLWVTALRCPPPRPRAGEPVEVSASGREVPTAWPENRSAWGRR